MSFPSSHELKIAPDTQTPGAVWITSNGRSLYFSPSMWEDVISHVALFEHAERKVEVLNYTPTIRVHSEPTTARDFSHLLRKAKPPTKPTTLEDLI